MIDAMSGRKSRRRAVTILLAVLTLTPVLASVAIAEPATGACCLVGGGCEDLPSFTCESQGGSFIGNDTSCNEIACETSLSVPLLSIFGLVSAAGMLGGFGLYRLLFRSR
jgi:hypothetical protein